MRFGAKIEHRAARAYPRRPLHELPLNSRVLALEGAEEHLPPALPEKHRGSRIRFLHIVHETHDIVSDNQERLLRAPATQSFSSDLLFAGSCRRAHAARSIEGLLRRGRLGERRLRRAPARGTTASAIRFEDLC